MKKTLALLLALLMIISVVLVSCGKKGNESDDTLGNDDDFAIPSGSASDDATGTGTGTGTGSNNIGSTFVDKNDTVYVLCDAKLREDAKVKSSNVIDTVPFKTALKRTKVNNKWSEVTYEKNGTPLKGYIANDLITTNAKSVEFVDQGTADAPVVTKIKDNLGTNNAVIRAYPIADNYPNKFQVITAEDDAALKVGQIPKGTANVTVVSVSADGVWAYVKGIGDVKESGGTYTNTHDKPVQGYCLYSSLEISGSANSGASGSNGIG